MISIDATDEEQGPFDADPRLLDLNFGAFDDSLLQKEHASVNAAKWKKIGRERFSRAPAGGELSYSSDHDQKHALDTEGPHGVSFEKQARDFGLSFAIANDQPAHQKRERLLSAGLACGYRFRVVALEGSSSLTRVTIENVGVAPIYVDAFVTVKGVRAKESLRGLAPGAKKTFEVPASGKLGVACDRLVKGQEIELEGELR
jgi:hypothetical protein